MLRLKCSFLWCGNLDTSESRSEVAGRFCNVDTSESRSEVDGRFCNMVLEEDG